MAERGQGAGKLSVDELLARVRKQNAPSDERAVESAPFTTSAPVSAPPRLDASDSPVSEMLQRIRQRITAENDVDVPKIASNGQSSSLIQPLFLTLPAGGDSLPSGLDARLFDLVQISNKTGCAVRMVVGSTDADGTFMDAQKSLKRAKTISKSISAVLMLPSAKLDIRYDPTLGQDRLKLECRRDGDV